jgi:hypothetical protein
MNGQDVRLVVEVQKCLGNVPSDQVDKMKRETQPNIDQYMKVIEALKASLADLAHLENTPTKLIEIQTSYTTLMSYLDERSKKSQKQLEAVQFVATKSTELKQKQDASLRYQKHKVYVSEPSPTPNMSTTSYQ